MTDTVKVYLVSEWDETNYCWDPIAVLSTKAGADKWLDGIENRDDYMVQPFQLDAWKFQTV